MDLVIDVGNSETVFGVIGADVRTVEDTWRISTGVPRTADEYGLLLRALVEGSGRSVEGIRRAVVGSVVPAATTVLRDTLGRLGVQTYIVDASVELPVRLDVEEPLTVGADRIVNTLAAKELYGRDTIAVDFGTATTYDCITADGVFVGGVIAQGVQAGLDWLGRRTAKLPRVEFGPPEAVIGRRTEVCMQSGVFFSATDAVDGIVTRIKAEWDRPEALVVGTGGYAESIGPHCRTVEVIAPHLTLIGLGLAGEEMAK